MLQHYYTIQNDGSHEIVIKKSRFICSLKRTEREDEAKAFIADIKKEHWKANHNCSAYVLGDYSDIQRYSDDGEPSGTAGIPMLDVLKKKELINTVAVVTRYFGGIKLGAGGLVRAYTQSVADAIHSIGIVEGIPMVEMIVSYEYSLHSKFENFIKQSNYELSNSIYTDKIASVCMVEEKDTEQFKEEVIQLLSAKCSFEEGEVTYFEKKISD